jgi:YD repeat-containing protein
MRALAFGKLIAICSGFVCAIYPATGYAQLNGSATLRPDDTEQFDENGVALTSDTNPVTVNLIGLSSTDYQMPKFGEYSNLSINRMMRYPTAISSDSVGFAANGFHSFDISVNCYGCEAVENPYHGDGSAMLTIQVFMSTLSFNARYDANGMMYDSGGRGNIFQQYRDGANYRYKLITADGTVIKFITATYQGLRLYADNVTFPNGETLSFVYDDIVEQDVKRLKSVEDNFGNKLLFSYLSPAAQFNAQDRDAHLITSKINIIIDSVNHGSVDYAYNEFPAAANQVYRYVPRSLSSVTRTIDGKSEQLESYGNQYFGSVLQLQSYFMPSHIYNRNGVADTSYELWQLATWGESGKLRVTKPGVIPQQYSVQTTYYGTYTANVNTVAPHVIKQSGGATEKFFMSDIPTYKCMGDTPYCLDPEWNLQHAWTQRQYCPVDEAGNVYCSFNHLLTRKQLANGYNVDYKYDGLGRTIKVTLPEGNSTEYVYNERGSVTLRKATGKDGAVTEERAAYPANCVNTITCNKPEAVTDARGFVTNYSYDPVHGGLLTETKPAGADGVRPQTRYEYAQRSAWLRNAGGGYEPGSPVWLKVRERYCRTTAAAGPSCTGGANDEVVTDFDYGPNSGPNRLLLRGIAVTSLNGLGLMQTLRTCYRYDTFGRKISETKPSANLPSCP